MSFQLKTMANLSPNLNKYGATSLFNLDTIMEIVAEVTCISKEMFQGKSRKRKIVEARQLYCFFAKKYTNKTLGDIGAAIRPFYNHATVLHSIKSVNSLYEFDKLIFNQVGIIDERLDFYRGNNLTTQAIMDKIVGKCKVT